MTEFDLDSIIANIQPNLVTPNLVELVSISNTKKPRKISEYIVRGMHASLTNPVTKDIIHDGEIHKIRYFDIEPLMSGVWSEISLMLLHLSYGEQVSIIETIYPKSVQLTAKAFALNFTPDTKTTDIRIENDTELVDKLDSANAGIATIIAMLREDGSRTRRGIHPDHVKKEMLSMKDLVLTQREIDTFVDATKRAQDAAKFQDSK